MPEIVSATALPAIIFMLSITLTICAARRLNRLSHARSETTADAITYAVNPG